MSILTSVKRLVRQQWHLLMAVAAVGLVAAAIWLTAIRQDPGVVVLLAGLAVVMIGIALLLARTLRLQRDNAELRRDLGHLARLVSDMRPHASLRRSLETGPADEAARIGELMSTLRRESDLRHAELRLMTDDVVARADRTDRLLDDLRSELARGRQPGGSGV